jgi:hypothetical protein
LKKTHRYTLLAGAIKGKEKYVNLFRGNRDLTSDVFFVSGIIG